MLRFLTWVVVLAALAGGAGYAQWRFQPCEKAWLPLDGVAAKYGLAPRAKCDTAAAKAESEPPREIEPPAVTVVKASTRRFVERLFVSGTLTAREEVMVAPKIADMNIAEIDAEDGDRVTKGQLLARLDRNQLDAQLAQNDAAIARAGAAINQSSSNIQQAQSQLQFAASEYDRAKRLGSGIMAASAVEQRETNMKAAEAALAAAKDALSVSQADLNARQADRQELMVRIGRTEVRAPVAGLISRRSARLGATASLAGDPLFRIVKDDAVDLVADVPEQWLPRLKPGMAASLKLPGVDQPVAGAVRLVDQEVDKLSRTGKARIALSDTAHARIGAFASGEVDLLARDGVAAPTTAVKRDGDEGFALVVKDGKVESRAVKLGIVEGDEIEILSGVAPGDTLVARAASFLRPGDRVRPIAEVAAGG